VAYTLSRATLSWLSLVCLLASPASAQGGGDAVAPEAAACGDEVEVDRDRFLRQVTLDLWGRVPSVVEYAALAAEPVFDQSALEALVDTMIAAPEFDTFVDRHHADLLWPNVNNLDFISPTSLLLPAAFYGAPGDGQRLFNLFIGLYERRQLFAPCKDEPAEFDETGRPVMEEMIDGTRREGWVMVEPYWAPGTQVKVCALEARTAAINEYGMDCLQGSSQLTGQCGCGPNLERCASIEVFTETVPLLREQMMRMVKRPIAEGRPYTDILTDVSEEVTGPLVHYYRHIARYALDPLVAVAPIDLADVEDMNYTDRDWRTVTRAAEEHAGVLTSTTFLLRFQTARSRANRFYNAFLCEPFQAPNDGLPSPNDECSQEPNLRERCGCNYCHARLEPASAHWGRFAEAGTMYVDPAIYPVFSQRCAACAENPDAPCDPYCDKFYVTDIGHPKQAPFAGVLKSYEFRPPEEVASLEAGPRALVDLHVADGRIAACAATQVFRRLYRREPTQDEQLFELAEIARDFQGGNFDFKQLVRTLLVSEGYRRMVR